jgi:hypothetical protein
MSIRHLFSRTLLVGIVCAARAAGAEVYLSGTALVFGTTIAKAPVTNALFVANDGNGPLRLTGYLVGGANSDDFSVAETSTCTKPTVLQPGERCRLDLVFKPGADGTREAALKVYTDFNLTPEVVALTGQGISVAKPTDTYQVIAADPPYIEFGARAAGASTAVVRVRIVNSGTKTASPETVDLIGRRVADYVVGDTDCTQPTRLAPGDSCHVDIRFAPRDTGPLAAVLRVRFRDDSQINVTLFGAGGVLPEGARVDVIEYYNAGFDHYFISSLTPDIVANDTGANAGWTRTGRVFSAFASARAGSSPVCRFYIPPQLGNSHFYSASPAECAEVRAKFPTFTLEATDVMHAYLPDGTSGACPASAIPVYRVWNKRADSNHRYTTDLGVRDAMVARGYVAEGYGPDGVALCSPF